MMRSLTEATLVVLIVMASSAMVSPQLSEPEPAQGGKWQIVIVDSDGEGGGGTGEYWFTSIALDSTDSPHISYFDGLNENLKYAKWSGNTWYNETIDNSTNVGAYSSLALDNNDNPHIGYFDGINHDLKYARWNGSAWNCEIVDSFSDVGEFPSIALDSNDNPHISYQDRTNLTLKYAKWNGSAWIIQTVDSSTNVGAYSSLALDSSEKPHISYFDGGNFDLKYAKWNGNMWKMETVDSNGRVGEYSSLVLDSSDYPHIGYFDYTNGDVKYAKWKGTGWSIKALDSSHHEGYWTSLALDSNGHPHLSYFDEFDDDLKYAVWNGSAWNIETVDTDGNTGYYTSLAIDSYDNPHISYYQRWVGNVKYATKAKPLPSYPLPPTSLRITVDRLLDVKLDWVSSESPNVTHYLIYRSENQTDFDFLTPIYNTSSDIVPLRTNWTDIGAADRKAPQEYYYVVQAADSRGSKSVTSNTAGKWTREFSKGLNAFSLPLEPFEETNISWYAERIPNATFINWMSPSGHWITYHRGMGSDTSDMIATMGFAYEIHLRSESAFTFCGHPGSMIRFAEGREGDSLQFRKGLAATVENDDVVLKWRDIANISGYRVFRSDRRNGLHNLSLQSIARVGSSTTSWRDVGVLCKETEYYYMVIPVNASGSLGSSTYSVGIFNLEYQGGSDTFALPLDSIEVHTLDWFCDHIPGAVGLAYMISGMWKFHSKEMPPEVYNVDVLQSEGYEISLEGGLQLFTFIGH